MVVAVAVGGYTRHGYPSEHDYPPSIYPVIWEEAEMEEDNWENYGDRWEREEPAVIKHLVSDVVNKSVYDPEVPSCMIQSTRSLCIRVTTSLCPLPKPCVRRASCWTIYYLWTSFLHEGTKLGQKALLMLARATIHDPHAAVRQEAFATLVQLASQGESLERRSLVFRPLLASLSGKRVHTLQFSGRFFFLFPLVLIQSPDECVVIRHRTKVRTSSWWKCPHGWLTPT